MWCIVVFILLSMGHEYDTSSSLPIGSPHSQSDLFVLYTFYSLYYVSKDCSCCLWTDCVTNVDLRWVYNINKQSMCHKKTWFCLFNQGFSFSKSLKNILEFVPETLRWLNNAGNGKTQFHQIGNYSRMFTWYHVFSSHGECSFTLPSL